MLEDLFVRAYDCRRIRGNPIGPALERYVEYLAGRGHSRHTVHHYVCAAEHFGRWLGRKPLSRAKVERFLRRHLPVCRCRLPAVRDLRCNRPALHQLLAAVGVAAIRFARRRGFVWDLLRRYEEALVMVRGLATSTVKKRLAWARGMLTNLRVRRAGQLRTWSAERVARYVVRNTRGHKPGSGQVAASAIRSFLRFLLQEGLICRDLSAAVPTFAHWRMAALPETLQEKEVTRLAHAADARTSLGRRDRALLLCLSELGLRASDVAELHLEDVNTAARVLRLRRRKERESVLVPMTQNLTGALGAYICRGRPACSTRSVFVLHRAPRGKPLTPIGIRDVVQRLADRVGLGHRVRGTHILRHSVASRMLGAGASLKQIADLLGHQSIDTTMIYAKVDLGALAQVALPWPGTKEVQP